MGAFSLIVVINLLNRMFIGMLSALKLRPCSSLSACYINLSRFMRYKSLWRHNKYLKKNEKKIEVASRKNEKAPQNASESFGVIAEPVQKTSEKDSSKRHVKDAKIPVKDANSSLKDTNEEIPVLYAIIDEFYTRHSSVASRKNEKAPQNASDSLGVIAEPVQKTCEKDSSKSHIGDIIEEISDTWF